MRVKSVLYQRGEKSFLQGAIRRKFSFHQSQHLMTGVSYHFDILRDDPLSDSEKRE